MGHFVVGQDFSIPLGIETDLEKSGGEDSKKYFVKLLAGDNIKDIQQEIVEPEGFILDYLMKGGYFNYDHGKGAENLIGEPTDYELVKNTTTGYCGLLIKGFFYKSKSLNFLYWLNNYNPKNICNLYIPFSFHTCGDCT